MHVMISHSKTRIIIILILALAASMAATAGFIHWRNTHYVCNSDFIVNSKEGQAALRFTFIINGDNGTVTYDGTVNSDEKTYSVGRAMSFAISHSGNWYQVRSIKLDTSPADNVPSHLLARLLPEFYNHANTLFEFIVTTQGWNGFIYSTGVMPSFYCGRD